MSYLPLLDALPEPGDRYTLKDIIGTGVCAKVYRAIDNENEEKIVAIKIQKYEDDLIEHIEEEYRVFRDLSNHPNLPNFYGVYIKRGCEGPNEIWFVMEYCEGGPVVDLIRGLQAVNKRMSEEHIAFILRETAKAVLHLHSNHSVHRDIRGNNILITKEGEIKLCDFGLARDIKSTMGKLGTCIGSPAWMAPEIFTSASDEEETYGSRADVWALGITAIELGDGKPPYSDMHPTRIMFQIVRNPPPTLYRPANWTQKYNDFIAECLEKNQENRPYLVELMEHPFFTELPENDYHLSQELKMFLNDIGPYKLSKTPEVAIYKEYIMKHDTKPEKMVVEDLAALEKLTEERILDEINSRLDNGCSYTFVGDVLLSLNSNEIPTEYERSFQNKYLFKSRSDNAPHIFAVADSAYQDMMHHEEPQYIVLSGETYSGKTTNFRLLVKHLGILGAGNSGISTRISAAIDILHCLVNAGTPINADATKCFFQMQLTFGCTGKTSGAIFWIYLLEKLRVSSTDMSQSNFHIFYYFYDAMNAEERLNDFQMESGRDYRYLRIPETEVNDKLTYCRNTPDENVAKFKAFEQNLLNLEFQNEQLEKIYSIIAAILILGDVRYRDNETDGQKVAELENPEIAQRVANLLKVDEKKFQWALLNYCVVEKGTAVRRRHTADEARDARDVLASAIYTRLVDWIVNTINQKLALSRAVFGDTHSVTLIDLFGFECFQRNHMEQLAINCLNEQMQYQYNQRMFAFEMIDHEEEMVPVIELHFYDNKQTIDHLMSKPNGLFCILDDGSKGRHGYEFLTESVAVKNSTFVQRVAAHEFTIAHYTGKVTYDVRDFPDKNRDFLPPEMVETLRSSEEPIIKTMFTNKLSKTGNLTMANAEATPNQNSSNQKSKWGAALVAEKTKTQRLNTLSHGQYSQIHKMRTMSSVFRATSLEILKSLSIGANTGGTHYVRCIRADLEYKPRGFLTDMVRQQIKAMAILDTAVAKQRGFSHRIPFQEFLRRYKFLAFEFDENVELTKDNCRLLLIRLKLEGWVIGTSKVFLKYYNEEYLSRLYETQVKKIIKVQAMMRAFLAKRNVALKLKSFKRNSETIELKKQSTIEMNEVEAVIRIQKAFRGYIARKQYGPLINARTGKLDLETANFVRVFAKKWRAKTIYQVLLHYRAARYQDLVNFSQQVHIYNQRLVVGLTATSPCVLLERIDVNQRHQSLLGPKRQTVWKIPFRLDEIPFFDTTYLCDPTQLNCNYTGQDSDNEDWDAPLRRRSTLSSDIIKQRNSARKQHTIMDDKENYDDSSSIVNEPFCRDPSMTIKRRAPRPPTVPSNKNHSAYNNMSAYSPSPYVRPTLNDVRDHSSNQSYENNVVVGNKAVIYKKRPAPRTPSIESLDQSASLRGSKKRVAPKPQKEWEPKSGPEFIYTNSLESRKPLSQTTQVKINPIREMQLIAQRNADEKSPDDDDNPPFNFQGILRKTKYNRASMKRSTDDNLLVSNYDDNSLNNMYQAPSNLIIDIQNNNINNLKNIRSRTPDDTGYIETSSNYTNVVYHSGLPERPKSHKRNVNHLSFSPTMDNIDCANNNMMTNNSFGNGGRDPKLENYNENIIDSKGGTYVKEEILPGIILEGYLAHL